MISRNLSKRQSPIKKTLLAILGLLLLNFGGFAQNSQANDTLNLDGKLPHETIGIIDFFRCYYGSTNKQTFDKILAQANFKVYQKNEADTHRSDFTWLRISINNTSKTDTLSVIMFLSERKLIEVHQKNSLGVFKKTIDWGAWGGTTTSKERFEIPIKIAPKQNTTYWLKTSDYIYFGAFVPELFSEKFYEGFGTSPSFNNTRLYGFLCMIIGLCFFMGIFAFVQCVYSKDATYGFWSLYLLTNTLFFFAELDRSFALGIFKYIMNDDGIRPWTIPVQYLVQINYLLFLNSFLKIKQNNSIIYLYIKVTIVLMFSAFVFAFVTVFNHDLGLTDYADMLIIPTNFLILIIAVKVLHTAIPQTKLILIGTFGVLLAATLAGISEIFELKNNLNFWLIPIICYAFGAVWELSWFSLALSERTRLIQLENQTLQKNYTKQLETELAERVNIIQTQNKLLEEQRIISLTSEFEQKIAETEISALRSQMNPHFIFNCLNSIKLYSLENDSQAASDYLTKFSRLIRMVLENSRSEKVTLENELETLELYIQMEAMRFKDKVKYQINIDQNIDQQFIEIPPLLIQPFVENAIWHGLMHKTEGGLVKIDVSQPKDQMLLIEISDNGIGREKALAYKSKSVMKNKSLGMKVTSERIELINQIYKTNTNVEIIDLKDKNGEALGTKVILNIPI
jgi:sensor histidine kinase YesM